jgi:hypothetical protein
MNRRAEPPEDDPKGQTIWLAKFEIGDRKDRRYFRTIDDFGKALSVAEELMEKSPACRAFKAKLLSVSRVARLWN